MKLKTALLLICLVVAANAQKLDPMLDQIAGSLPQMDPAWKHKGTEMYKRADGCTQASIKWSKGDVEQGATVIIHPTLKKAQLAFRSTGKEDLQEDFRIDGIGDDAFLWPPKAPAGGAYNIRFRKGRVEVWMGAVSENDVKRIGLAIVAAITKPKKPV